MNRGLSLLVMVVCFLMLSCGPKKASVYKKTRPLMDTLVTLTVVAGSEKEADTAIEKAFSVIEDFSRRINLFSDESELSAINRNSGIAPVSVSPDTAGVIDRARHIAEISGGAFDPTIGPLIKMWDFHNSVRPSDEQIKKKIALVNYRDIVQDNTKSTVFLRKKGMVMDLGGIAKGYAADLALASLKQSGIRAGIVAAAGDIRTFGHRPDGKGWTVGIKNPRQKNESDEIMATLRASEKAISTSGDYERFFMEGGRRYHHILDPKTGYPADLCRSVTVISAKGIYADGFSTAVFVLGPEKGMKLAGEMGVETVIVDSSGTIHTSPGLKGVVTFEDRH